MSDVEIRSGIELRKYTSFRCGGKARLFAEPSSPERVAELINYAGENKIPVFVLGRGSNVLISDDGFDGLVIHIGEAMSDITVTDEEGGALIKAGAGASLARFGKTAVAHALKGAEFCCGIPGSVGGAVYMNAGAYGRSISDIARTVTYIEDGKVRTIDASECGFGYRQSVFEGKEDVVILGFEAYLESGDKTAIEAYVEELRSKRTSSQPLDVPSAGSTFKRPEGHFAGKLIEDCGLRGFALDDSGAQVSPKHCGFVVNNGGRASAADILKLINYVSDKVFDETGVRLEREVKLVGKF